MILRKKIENFLKKEKINYKIIEHKTVYTAADKARTLRVPEKNVAKTIIIASDNKISLALISANEKLDFQKFKKIAQAKKIKLISERVIKNKFKGVKIGNIPALGNLWNVPVFADKNFLKAKEIILNSGDYELSLVLSLKEFKKTGEIIFGNLTESKK